MRVHWGPLAVDSRLQVTDYRYIYKWKDPAFRSGRPEAMRILMFKGPYLSGSDISETSAYPDLLEDPTGRTLNSEL